QNARLRSRLARRPEWLPVITPDLLESEWTHGSTEPDTRWAVAAGSQTAPPDLKSAGGKMSGGVQELERAGLARAMPRGHGLTPEGERLVNNLGGIRRVSGLTLTGGEDRAPGQQIVARMSLFACADGLLS